MEFKDFIENSYIHIKDLHYFVLAPFSVRYRGRCFQVHRYHPFFLVKDNDLVWHYHKQTFHHFKMIQGEQNPVYARSEGLSTFSNLETAQF